MNFSNLSTPNRSFGFEVENQLNSFILNTSDHGDSDGDTEEFCIMNDHSSASTQHRTNHSHYSNPAPPLDIPEETSFRYQGSKGQAKMTLQHHGIVDDDVVCHRAIIEEYSNKLLGAAQEHFVVVKQRMYLQYIYFQFIYKHLITGYKKKKMH